MTATGFFGAGERAALLRDPEAFAARAEQVLSASVSKLRKLEAEHAAERIETEQARSLLPAAPPRPACAPWAGSCGPACLRAGPRILEQPSPSAAALTPPAVPPPSQPLTPQLTAGVP